MPKAATYAFALQYMLGGCKMPKAAGYVRRLQNAKGCSVCLQFAVCVCVCFSNMQWHFSATPVIKPSLCPGIFQPHLLSSPFLCPGIFQPHLLSNPFLCPGIFQPHLLSSPPSALAFFSHTCYQALPLPWHFSATPVIKPSLCPGIFHDMQIIITASSGQQCSLAFYSHFAAPSHCP
jgi:hypothetical protein